ncbi:MAG TPA: sulfatase-like hydrolase/transferase [Phycisphaerae bacterium]|nr:sulfatase-like hydrolase/transferase [Phycisphaerae bacterium]
MADARPNVLFILTDDQGVWSCGCYGNHEIRTPNIDRLAAAGLRFDSFFVATPVCSPSRATLLTGRIPSQHGVHDWLKAGNVGADAIRYLRGEVAYTDILSAHGWTCGLSGKWHLGDSQIPQHGFADWFVHQRGGGPYYDAPMVRNGRLVNEPGYVTDAITDEAVRLLDRYAEAGGPFYLSVHYTAPHSPWEREHHPAELFDSYADCPFETCPQEPMHPWARGTWVNDRYYGSHEALQGYAAAITAMDAGVGRLLERLEQLGLRESTLVVFLSDNGFSCGQHGFWGKGNGTNPRNMFENSIKVPAIFSQPGRIPAGQATDAMVSAYDFMPTLLEYLDLPGPPAERNLPGSSFLPLLEGGQPAGREHVVVFDEYGPVRMARSRDWKYVHRHAYGPHELYNLAEDPDERNNLVDDPTCKDKIDELRAVMDEWFARYVIPARNGLAMDGVEHGQTRYLPL